MGCDISQNSSACSAVMVVPSSIRCGGRAEYRRPLRGTRERGRKIKRDHMSKLNYSGVRLYVEQAPQADRLEQAKYCRGYYLR